MTDSSSSLAAARTLLNSGGRCDGCDSDIDLTGRTHGTMSMSAPSIQSSSGSDAADRDTKRRPACRPSDPYTPALRFRATDSPAVLCRDATNACVPATIGSFSTFGSTSVRRARGTVLAAPAAPSMACLPIHRTSPRSCMRLGALYRTSHGVTTSATASGTQRSSLCSLRLPHGEQLCITITLAARCRPPSAAMR